MCSWFDLPHELSHLFLPTSHLLRYYATTVPSRTSPSRHRPANTMSAAAARVAKTSCSPFFRGRTLPTRAALRRENKESVAALAKSLSGTGPAASSSSAAPQDADSESAGAAEAATRAASSSAPVVAPHVHRIAEDLVAPPPAEMAALRKLLREKLGVGKKASGKDHNPIPGIDARGKFPHPQNHFRGGRHARTGVEQRTLPVPASVFTPGITRMPMLSGFFGMARALRDAKEAAAAADSARES